MSDGLTLALDCATENLAVALVAADGRVRVSQTSLVGRRHAALLPAAVAEALTAAGAERTDITGIRVGIGPGSYTGIRVAIAAAKGLARALAVDLAGVSSFVGLAAAVLAPSSEAVVTLDARRGNVYAQACRRLPAATSGRAPQVTTLGEPLKLPVGEVAEHFAGLALAAAGSLDASALAVSSQVMAPAGVYL